MIEPGKPGGRKCVQGDARYGPAAAANATRLTAQLIALRSATLFLNNGRLRLSARNPTHGNGSTQKRVLLTPYRFAMPWVSAFGSGPSSSWFAFTCSKAACSFRFQRMSTPARFRGRVRPGPRFQYGFRRSEVRTLTSLRVNA